MANMDIVKAVEGEGSEEKGRSDEGGEG